MELSAKATDSQGQAGYQDFLIGLLTDRDALFLEVVEGQDLARKLRHALLTLVVISAFYGVAAGAYAGALQALSAGIKLPLLILATFVICFPAFFGVQILVGSRLRLLQVLVLALSALALTAIVLAAFVPITVFFLITGSNYYFLQLLHIIVTLGAGLFGMYALHEGLSLVCEKRGVYPRKALTIMRVWAILFAFVGIQMAWNLRPFLGDRGQPFRVFREYEGNFYAAIVYSLNQLFSGEGRESDAGSSTPQPTAIDELLQPETDSASPRP